MGAMMASGILDAGGRNATVGLKSRSGYFRRTAVVGLAIFAQYWCGLVFACSFQIVFAPGRCIWLTTCLPAVTLRS